MYLSFSRLYKMLLRFQFLRSKDTFFIKTVSYFRNYLGGYVPNFVSSPP